MSFALAAAVTGLKVHQSMLDVAGNNLANMNTTAYKSSTLTFSDLLSQTLQRASGPSGGLGGTNPQQKGSGVGVSTISKNMSQGNILSTGQDLDCAIDGAGYFVLSNGQQVVYSRIGSFAVDSENTLVDPATGYKVQRMSTATENFQTAGTNSIHIPYDMSMEANPTSEIKMNGNLRASAESSAATTHKSTANAAWTDTSTSDPAIGTSNVTDLQGYTAGGAPFAGGAGTLTVDYIDSAGVAQVGTVTVNAGTTVQDVIDDISTILGDSTVTVDPNGYLVTTANSAGYTQTQITGLTYANAGGGSTETWDPGVTYFDINTYGGNDIKNFNITIYDSLGDQHVLSGYFVKTDSVNTWDLVIGDVTGEVSKDWSGYNPANRRVEGVNFNSDGSYNGIGTGESLAFNVNFDSQPLVSQTITFDLGTVGQFDGITQFGAETSSAGAQRQDGYEAGQLASISIDQGGTLFGLFSNGERQEIATMLMSVFQNPMGLEAVGNGYFIPSANSGMPVDTIANNSGAGAVKGKSLEKSNVDVAAEFVNLMQAQNGYTANSRTIRVANDVLNTLTSIIR